MGETGDEREALLALADRCEAASGPDRELDEAIQDALFQRPTGRRYDYTASLGAAMTLIPEGWYLAWLTSCNEENVASACVTEIADPCRDAVGLVDDDIVLSLCAAALRAQAQSGDHP